MIADILGLNFLKACKVSLDFQSSFLKLKNVVWSFLFEWSFGCYRVIASNTTCLHPRREWFKQKVPGQNAFGSADYMVETETMFIVIGRSYVGRSLVGQCACATVEYHWQHSTNSWQHSDCTNDGRRRPEYTNWKIAQECPRVAQWFTWIVRQMQTKYII